ncbi:hypothetical protein [Halospeciosus flavus]|uniref:Uncharacterized protein n=1 Tax=Halospeciosus flavus TaxID=3032283 RepID=A0ABD5Z753_9EURY|nr:hypothetical protein [Halospeciosus flavus]
MRALPTAVAVVLVNDFLLFVLPGLLAEVSSAGPGGSALPLLATLLVVVLLLVAVAARSTERADPSFEPKSGRGDRRTVHDDVLATLVGRRETEE